MYNCVFWIGLSIAHTNMYLLVALRCAKAWCSLIEMLSSYFSPTETTFYCIRYSIFQFPKVSLGAHSLYIVAPTKSIINGHWAGRWARLTSGRTRSANLGRIQWLLGWVLQVPRLAWSLPSTGSGVFWPRALEVTLVQTDSLPRRRWLRTRPNTNP
jgi:hypothetical protein